MTTNPSTVQLVTRADVPTAEIIVTDGNSQFVHRAVGNLDVALAPGVYTVQYKVGAKVEEVPVVLRPGSGTISVPSPRLTFRSPAPLRGNAAGTRDGAFARNCSREVHVRNRQGGELFIFLRTSTQDAASSVEGNAGDNRLFQVTVLDDQQRILAELAKAGKRAQDGASLGCTLALNPGTYILRFDGADAGVLERSVVVSDGWQTQVLASSRPFGQERHVLGPNLPEAAAFMARPGTGFDPSEAELTFAESARQGLAEGRAVAPEDHLRAAVAEAKSIRQSVPEGEVSEMLRMKFMNPMLGIYGAHLMLLSGTLDTDLLAEVVINLKTLVGNHPDVIALTLRPELKHLTEQTIYTLPPMLRSSWKLVVAESVHRPQLVPVQSYSAAIANRTWGAGAWLLWWSPPYEQFQADLPAEHAAGRVFQLWQGVVQAWEFWSALATLSAYILKNLKDHSAASFIQQVTAAQQLSDTERTILIYLTSVLSQNTDVLALIRSHAGLWDKLSFYVKRLQQGGHWVTGSAPLDPAIASLLTQERLVQALGVPVAPLLQALVSLSKKLVTSSREQRVSQSRAGR